MRVRIRRFNKNNVVWSIVLQCFPALCFASRHYSGLRVSRVIRTCARDSSQLLQVRLVPEVHQVSSAPGSVLCPASSVSKASVSVSLVPTHPVLQTHSALPPVDSRLSTPLCSG